MIIRESDKLPTVELPSSELQGKHLMQHPYDDMQFGAYYVTIEAGKEISLKGNVHKTPIEEIKYSHGYFCMDGVLTASSVTDKNSTMGPYILKEGSFHMFPHSVTLVCNVEKKTTLIVIYVPEKDGSPAENVISGALSDLQKSKRFAFSLNKSAFALFSLNFLFFHETHQFFSFVN